MDKKNILKGIDYSMRTIRDFSQELEKHKDLAGKALETWKMNAQCQRDIKNLEVKSQVMIHEITEKYQLCRDVLTMVFGERQTSLNALYATLDKALQSDDRELIIASLKGICSIVEKNPLESFKEFSRVMDNKDETLYLDF